MLGMKRLFLSESDAHRMASLGAPFATTNSIGWPVALNIYKSSGNVYFDVTASMEYLGVQKRVKKHGFSFIDKFLSENGE